MDRLTDSKDIELLRIVAREEERNGSFRPWHGFVGRAKKLTKSGYLQENGISVMWPYLVYGTTDLGRAALAQSEEKK